MGPVELGQPVAHESFERGPIADAQIGGQCGQAGLFTLITAAGEGEGRTGQLGQRARNVRCRSPCGGSSRPTKSRRPCHGGASVRSAGGNRAKLTPEWMTTACGYRQGLAATVARWVNAEAKQKMPDGPRSATTVGVCSNDSAAHIWPGGSAQRVAIPAPAPRVERHPVNEPLVTDRVEHRDPAPDHRGQKIQRQRAHLPDRDHVGLELLSSASSKSGLVGPLHGQLLAQCWGSRAHRRASVQLQERCTGNGLRTPGPTPGKLGVHCTAPRSGDPVRAARASRPGTGSRSRRGDGAGTSCSEPESGPCSQEFYL